MLTSEKDSHVPNVGANSRNVGMPWNVGIWDFVKIVLCQALFAGEIIKCVHPHTQVGPVL
jgi:hypothetical protein